MVCPLERPCDGHDGEHHHTKSKCTKLCTIFESGGHLEILCTHCEACGGSILDVEHGQFGWNKTFLEKHGDNYVLLRVIIHCRSECPCRCEDPQIQHRHHRNKCTILCKSCESGSEHFQNNCPQGCGYCGKKDTEEQFVAECEAYLRWVLK